MAYQKRMKISILLSFTRGTVFWVMKTNNLSVCGSKMCQYEKDGGNHWGEIICQILGFKVGESVFHN